MVCCPFRFSHTRYSPPAMAPPVVSALPDELLEEVFLRLPPDEPECLVRASLTSKLWLDILSGPRFPGLYRELNGALPMLGFVYCPAIYSSEYRRDEDDKLPYFKPATKFRARIPDDDWGGWFYEPWDCRHGRVLLVDADGLAAEGDVVLAILKCDLASNCLSLIDVPPLETGADGDSETILMATEDGSLGFARLDMLNLYLWSRQMGFDGVLSWTQHRVINLKELLPIQNPKLRLTLVGSVEGSDTIFVTTDLGIYGISLKSRSVKKLWKREIFHYLMPYMSFYTPREKVNPANATH
ncbi:hypothetical protein ACQ4PT_064964 [Festuca glaucescens]